MDIGAIPRDAGEIVVAPFAVAESGHVDVVSETPRHVSHVQYWIGALELRPWSVRLVHETSAH